MKKNKLALSLDKFMKAYRSHYAVLAPQILNDMMYNFQDDPSFSALLELLDKDRKQVIETLQNSVSVNQVFFKVKNEFVEDFIKNLRDLNNVQEEEKRAQERDERNASKSSEKSKKIKQLVLDLDLSAKQKQILKTILDVQ